MAKERDQEFVEFIAKELSTKPEKVEVKRTIDEMGVLLELTVDKDDMAVIIGKEGRTAKAIRTLLRVIGAKNDARVNLKIVEPEGSEHASKEDKGSQPEADQPKAEKSESKEESSGETESGDKEESTEQVAEDDFVDLDEEKE